MGSSGLPEELMEEIMQRLPVKSLLRFKCVSKKWYHLIQNPNFINNQYNHPNNHTRLLVHYLQQRCTLDTPKRKKYRNTSQLLSLFSDETLSTTITEDIVNPLTPFDGSLSRIIGPVNGLFFVQYSSHGNYFDRQLALWNPATTEFRVLHRPILDRHPKEDFLFLFNYGFGFGLDPLTGDFKVVCIRLVGDNGLIVQIYSLANDSWRRIDSVFPSSLSHIRSHFQYHTYFDGAYYWLSCTLPRPTIVLFDMGREVFREIQTPLSCTKESYETRDSLVLFNDTIALLEIHYSNYIIESINVFVMKEDECWIKHSSIVGLPLIRVLRPLGFWMKGLLLFHNCQDFELVLYNPNYRKILKLGISWNGIRVLNYKASLASVKGGSKLCQTSHGSTNNKKKRKRTALTEKGY